nr:MAG TPA: hypothetical protein [Inoviridae sp.]
MTYFFSDLNFNFGRLILRGLSARPSLQSRVK